LDADPDADPGYQNDADPCGSESTTLPTVLAFFTSRKSAGTLQQPEPAAWRLRPGGPPALLAEAGRRIHGHLQPAASPPPPRPRQVQDAD
jgi:hypothetical protein